MTFSLNEIEAMGRRAARGAGLTWGLAEEAGKAARWLSARGLAGPEALADILTRNDGKPYDDLAPDSVEGRWRAPAGPLCPLVVGPALCDRAGEIAAGRAIELGPIAHPLLLAPFAAGAAALAETPVQLSWAGAMLTCGAEEALVAGAPADLTVRIAERVWCSRADGEAEAGPVPERSERSVDAETWSRLAAFASRTLAPATEASRLAGAGAGLNDND